MNTFLVFVVSVCIIIVLFGLHVELVNNKTDEFERRVKMDNCHTSIWDGTWISKFSLNFRNSTKSSSNLLIYFECSRKVVFQDFLMTWSLHLLDRSIPHLDVKCVLLCVLLEWKRDGMAWQTQRGFENVPLIIQRIPDIY